MENRITGVMIYYYFVCRRKLWYFCHEIRMEAENEDVILGKILDESSYSKNEKHINIDNIINIDFISEHKELHEVKKSKAVEDAGIWQASIIISQIPVNIICRSFYKFFLQVSFFSHSPYSFPPVLPIAVLPTGFLSDNNFQYKNYSN